jgi:hypothetical protein
VEAVKVLLAKGASVNAVDGMFAATPLVWACEGWRTRRKTAQIMLKWRACCLLPARRANGWRRRKPLIPRERRTAWRSCAG